MSILNINKDNWKRKTVIFKTVLSRGYIWCQLPALSIIGAGVLAPYFPEIRLVYLAAIALTIMMLVGWIDVWFHFFHEEQRYITEQNPTLMKGLFEDKSKYISAQTELTQPLLAQDIIDEINEENKNE